MFTDLFEGPPLSTEQLGIAIFTVTCAPDDVPPSDTTVQMAMPPSDLACASHCLAFVDHRIEGQRRAILIRDMEPAGQTGYRVLVGTKDKLTGETIGGPDVQEGVPASALGQIVFGETAKPFDVDACLTMGVNLVVDAVIAEIGD